MFADEPSQIVASETASPSLGSASMFNVKGIAELSQFDEVFFKYNVAE